MNFRQLMKEKHINASRIEHIKRTIEHCISVIAICEIGGQTHAKASYEARLKQLNLELQELFEQTGEKK